MLSREEELRKLDPKLLARYSCYAPKDWLADVALEDDGNGAANAADYSDLHAKIYLAERHSERNLYLGSPNASRNGMQGNVEALLRLKLRKRKIQQRDVLDALVGEKKPFSLYNPNAAHPLPAEADAEEARTVELDRCFHAAAKLFEFRSVDVTGSDNKIKMHVSYSMPLFSGFAEGLALALEPYLAPGAHATVSSPEGSASYDGLSANQVSELFVLCTESPDDGYRASCLIRCPDRTFHCDMGRDDRVRRVLESILNADADALPAYIALAFGVEPQAVTAQAAHNSPNSSQRNRAQIVGGIYESLLRGLANAPDARNQLEYAKLMLSFLPERFDDDQVLAMRGMVDEFEKAVRRHV